MNAPQLQTAGKTDTRTIVIACASIGAAALTVIAGFALADYIPKSADVTASRSICRKLIAAGADASKIDIKAFSCQITDAQVSRGRVSVKTKDGSVTLGPLDVADITIKN